MFKDPICTAQPKNFTKERKKNFVENWVSYFGPIIYWVCGKRENSHFVKFVNCKAMYIIQLSTWKMSNFQILVRNQIVNKN